MIETNKLTKRFGDVYALRDLNMKVPKGSVYGLVGPNGAGKTTALQHISGAMRPTEGQVTIFGQPVFGNADVKETIAFIPSDFYYYRQATVKDMRDLHASLFPRFDVKRFEELQSVFPISQSLNMRSLSKGMTKQVAFWLALSQHPDVLLLDEPLDGLDPAARHLALGLVMEEVAARQMTVLVSSHNLRELADICDYVGILESGHMRLESSLAELQGSFVKVQVAFADENTPLPDELNIAHATSQGKLHTLVVRGDAQEVESLLVERGATFINVIPLSLEEVFIYEVGRSGNEFEIAD